MSLSNPGCAPSAERHRRVVIEQVRHPHDITRRGRLHERRRDPLRPLPGGRHCQTDRDDRDAGSREREGEPEIPLDALTQRVDADGDADHEQRDPQRPGILEEVGGQQADIWRLVHGRLQR